MYFGCIWKDFLPVENVSLFLGCLICFQRSVCPFWCQWLYWLANLSHVYCVNGHSVWNYVRSKAGACPCLWKSIHIECRDPRTGTVICRFPMCVCRWQGKRNVWSEMRCRLCGPRPLTLPPLKSVLGLVMRVTCNWLWMSLIGLSVFSDDDYYRGLSPPGWNLFRGIFLSLLWRHC